MAASKYYAEDFDLGLVLSIKIIRSEKFSEKI
jgi:hypothetical protein